MTIEFDNLDPRSRRGAMKVEEYNRTILAFSRAAIKELLDAHIPSITNDIEPELEKLAGEVAYSYGEPGEPEVADLALRECGCGKRIDGFYEYVDHLREVFGVDSSHAGEEE